MRISKMDDFYIPTPGQDRDAFLRSAMAEFRRPRHTAAQLNAFYGERLPEDAFTPLPDSFSAIERERRFALAGDLRRKALARIADKAFVPVPATGLRFPEEFMMTRSTEQKDIRENERIAAVMKNPAEHTKEALDLIINMFESVINMHPEQLLGREMSDRELVDNFDKIEKLGSFGTQLENFRNYLRQNIRPGNPDEENSYNRCMRAIDNFEPFADGFSSLCSRIDAINNPYYSILDPQDPAVRKFTFDIGNHDDELDTEPDEPMLSTRSTDFVDFTTCTSSSAFFGCEAELKAAKQYFSAFGTDPDGLFWRVAGSDEEPKPLSAADISYRLSQTPDTRLELFDPSRPDVPVLPLTDDASLPLSRMVNGMRGKFPAAPTAPAEVPAPGAEPEAPSALASFFHRITFGFLYRTRFSNYRRDMNAYYDRRDRYVSYRKAVKQYETDSTLHQAALRAFDAQPAPQRVSAAQLEDTADALEHPREAQTFLDIYGAERRMRKEWENSVYRTEVMQKMAENEKDLSVLSPFAQKISNEDFAALSLGTVLSPGFLGKIGPVPDSMPFEDMVISGTSPRQNQNSVIEGAVEPARDAVYDCLRNFYSPVPGSDPAVTGRTQLARYLAAGLNEGIGRLCTKAWNGSSYVGMYEMLNHTLETADRLGMRDALTEAGLTEKSLEDLRIASRAAEVVRDGMRAEQQLNLENHGKIRLSDEERRDCIDKIVLSKTLSAEQERYKNDHDIDMNQVPDEPVRMQGETAGAFRARKQAYMQALTAIAAKQAEEMSKPKEFSPITKDLLAGGSQLRELSYRLIPEEKRAAVIASRPGASDAHRAFEALSFTHAIVSVDMMKEQPGAAKEIIEAHKAEKPSSDRIPAGQKEVLTEHAHQEAPADLSPLPQEAVPPVLADTASVLQKKAVSARDTLEKKCTEEQSFVGGSEVRDIISYRAFRNTVAEGKLNDDLTGFYAREDCSELSGKLIDRTPELSYIADHPHDGAFYEEHVLSGKGLEELSEKFSERLDEVIEQYHAKGKHAPETAPVKEENQPSAEEQKKSDSISHAAGR